jgi:hypothetical protein
VLQLLPPLLPLLLLPPLLLLLQPVLHLLLVSATAGAPHKLLVS